jgi:periplasmic protein TonB
MNNGSKLIPDLDDLAYTGRNRLYGSYSLRRKYKRTLLISFAAGILIFAAMFMIPFLVYWIGGNEMKFSQEELYAVEYNFIPSPENVLPQLPKLAAPAEETPRPPVVVDTVPEKKQVKEEVKPEETKPENKSDSISGGKGNNPQGTGNGEDSGIYTTIDVFPKFPGGDLSRLAFLRNNIRYPENAHKQGLQGVVMVIFVVETDGTVTNVQVSKGIGAGCDDEAIRVTKLMPRWEPGRRSGKAVRVMVRMPIVFKIPGKT